MSEWRLIELRNDSPEGKWDLSDDESGRYHRLAPTSHREWCWHNFPLLIESLRVYFALLEMLFKALQVVNAGNEKVSLLLVTKRNIVEQVLILVKTFLIQFAPHHQQHSRVNTEKKLSSFSKVKKIQKFPLERSSDVRLMVRGKHSKAPSGIDCTAHKHFFRL